MTETAPDRSRYVLSESGLQQQESETLAFQANLRSREQIQGSIVELLHLEPGTSPWFAQVLNVEAALEPLVSVEALTAHIRTLSCFPTELKRAAVNLHAALTVPVTEELKVYQHTIIHQARLYLLDNASYW